MLWDPKICMCLICLDDLCSDPSSLRSAIPKTLSYLQGLGLLKGSLRSKDWSKVGIQCAFSVLCYQGTHLIQHFFFPLPFAINVLKYSNKPFLFSLASLTRSNSKWALAFLIAFFCVLRTFLYTITLITKNYNEPVESYILRVSSTISRKWVFWRKV